MYGVAFRDTGHHLRDLLALVQAADDAGYSSIWTPEVGSRDALVLSALYGSVTKHATIGTGIVPVYSRNVPSLAMSSAVAAEACGGRFILGLGTGHRFSAEAWFGETWSHPRTRLEETMDVLRRMWSGERVSHHGTFDVDGFGLGSTPPAIPIYLAALTPRSLRLAGSGADGVILNWLPPEGIEEASLVAREAAADAGRRIRVVTYVRVAVVEEPEHEHAAREALREQTYAYLSIPTYANAVRRHGFGEQLDAMAKGAESVIDDLVDALCAFGDAKKVRAKLESFERTVDGVIVYPVPFGDEGASSILRTLRAIVS